MLQRYTQEQMVSMWLSRKGFTPSPGLSGIQDFTSLSETALAEAEAWYSRQLAEATPCFLPREEISEEVTARYITRNAARLSLPERCVRPLTLKMADWRHTVCEFPPLTDYISAREEIRALASTPFAPKAYLRPDGDLEAHGLEREPQLTSYYTSAFRATPGQTAVPSVSELSAVVRPADGSFIFDPALLESSSPFSP